MTFKELQDLYSENFTLSYLGKSFENKIALISLICYVTYKNQLKKPDVTHYQVIKKIADDVGGMPTEFINALAVMCEDLSYGCTEFPTFGLQGKDILVKIKEIFLTYIPF